MVKRISRRPPEPEVQVRFLAGAFAHHVRAQVSLISTYCSDTVPRRRVGSHGISLWRTKEAAMDLPKCQKCNRGALIPLSDYGQEGASVLFKAWVCTNPECGFSLRVDKGEVTYGKKIDFKH